MSRRKPVKKTNSQPSLTDAISTVDGRAESIQKKIGELESKLEKYEDQMKKMRDAGSSKNMVEQRAMRVLKRKNMYESQLEGLRNQSFNLEQTNYAMQNTRDTKAMVNAMKTGTKALKKLNKRTSKEDVEDVMDKTAALVKQSDDVQQILGRSSSPYHECSDSEEDLEAELDALSDDSEVLEDEGTSLLNNTVIAPDPDSVVAGPPQHINDVQDGQPSIQDEHGDPAEIGANGNPSSSDRRNNEDQEPGIGVVPVPGVPIPLPVVPPLVIPAVIPPAPPVPSVPLPSTKKSGDKPSRDKKNEEKKENKKKDKKDKDKKKRKTEQDERDAEEPDRDNNKKCEEEEDHCDKEDDRDRDRPDPPEHSSNSSSDSEEEEKDGKKESRWKKFKRKFSFKRKVSSKSNAAVLQRQKYHVDSNDYGPSTTGTELSHQHTLMSRPMEDNSEINVQNYPSPSRQPRRQAPPPPSPSHSDHQHEMDSLAASTHRGSQHGKTSSPPTRPLPYHTTKTQDHKSPLHRSYTAPSSSSRPQHSESPSTPVHPLPPRTKSLGNDPSFQLRCPAPPPPGLDSSSCPSRPEHPAPPPPETQRQYTDDSHRGHTPQQDVTSQQCKEEDV